MATPARYEERRKVLEKRKRILKQVDEVLDNYVLAPYASRIADIERDRDDAHDDAGHAGPVFGCQMCAVAGSAIDTLDSVLRALHRINWTYELEDVFEEEGL